MTTLVLLHTDRQSLLKEVNHTIHSTFCHSTFCPIRHYFYSTFCPIRYYFYSTFCPIRHYVTFGLYHFRHYVSSAFCPIRHFVRSTFCIIWHFVIRHFDPFDVLTFDVLNFRRLLLRHFIGEPYFCHKQYRLPIKIFRFKSDNYPNEPFWCRYREKQLQFPIYPEFTLPAHSVGASTYIVRTYVAKTVPLALESQHFVVTK